MVASATIAAVGGAPPPADASPGHRAERPGEVQAWVVDGRLAAVRRSPLPPGAYGGHGVDYAPATWPIVRR